MNMVELEGKKVMVHPSQADSTKGQGGCHRRGEVVEDDPAQKPKGRPMEEK
jgi:hypothetical protein